MALPFWRARSGPFLLGHRARKRERSAQLLRVAPRDAQEVLFAAVAGAKRRTDSASSTRDRSAARLARRVLCRGERPRQGAGRRSHVANDTSPEWMTLQ